MKKKLCPASLFTKKRRGIHQQKGIGMVEIIVCLAIMAVTFWAFLALAKYNLKIQEQSQAKIETINLAAETIEAVRSIRDENWDNLATLALETEYYPVISGNKWTLTSTNPGLINGIYDRWLILEKVYRNSDADIIPSGTEDPQTKKITAVVEWIDRGKTKQISLTTYLTNWTD